MKKGPAQGSLDAAHTYLLPQKGAIQGSSRTRRPEDTYLLPQKGACAGVPGCREACSHLLVLRPPLGLPGFHLVQPGLETLAHPPQHAGEVRVVESNHLRAVAPPRGPRQILPLRSCEVVRGEAQPQVPVHVRALVLLGLHGVEELQELSHVGLGNLRLHPAVRQVREARVADHVARVARDHEAAGVPLVRGQGQLRREALGLHQRLVVDHDELALVRPAVPLQEDPRALVAQQPQLRAAVGGRAVVGHLQLAPARPVLRQEEIVREVGGVGHGERVGGEELRRGDRARARHVAADHAARRHSAARGREGAVQALGPAEAAPVIVSVAPVSAPVAAKLAAVAAPEAVSVPVDTSPTVVKLPALAVLLMVSVLPVIPVAELSRPTLAAPLMLSELPDTAPVDDSAAPATVPVAVSAAQETAPEASTPVVNTSVQFTSLRSSWSQPALPCAVSAPENFLAW